MYWFVLFTIFLLILSLSINLIFFFTCIWRDKQSKTRQVTQGLSVSIVALLITLICFELFFKLFFAQSDQFGTLADQNWNDRYWRTNSLGYRDIEWTPELLSNRTKVMVLGDSFVAGFGIKDPADRFSNQLGQMLGEEYAVMNVGLGGASTKSSLQNAIKYPYRPDVLIYTYYINDIQDTATDMGFEPPRWRPTNPFLVDKSYALNFFYWRIYRLGLIELDNPYGSWWDWYVTLYNDPQVWGIYQNELLQLHNLAKEQNIPLLIVAFPELWAVQDSQTIIGQVVDLYTGQGVPVLDVSKLITGMDSDQLTANAFDAHPNELVHKLVAKELHQMFLERTWPPPSVEQ